MFRKLGIGFAALAMLAPGFASALGVGDYTLKSYLNQPLKMEVELTDARDLAAEEVLVSLAAQQEFDAAGVERVYFLSDLNFEVELHGDGSGTLLISSVQPVREPFLNFLVEFLWPNGRLLREYTVLVDPPSYEGASVDSGTAAPVQRAPAAEPVAQQPVTVQMDEPAPAEASSERVVAQSSRPIQVVDRAEYVVQTDDTMWRIALNNRPVRSISVQQMLIAIQTLNQDAFIDGNVNLVREGTVLRMPTEEEVRQISTREALTEVAEQNRQWRAKLEARGIRVPTRPQVDGTRRKVDRDTVSSKAPTEGEVTLVAPESGDGGAGAASGAGDAKALQNEIAIREERVDQLARENQELSSRLADLDQQVQTSEQLLQLRNDQIAQLQEQLRKLQEQKGVAPTEPVQVAPVEAPQPVEPAVTEVTDAEPAATDSTAPADADAKDGEVTDTADAVTATDAEPATGTDVAADAAADADAVATDAEQAAPAPVAQPEPVVAPVQPTPAPMPEPSFIEQNMQMLAIAGVVVVAAVIGGLAFFARKRKAASAEAYSDEYDSYAEDDEDFLAPGGGDEEMDLDAFADGAGDDAGPADAGQDPMEEVDVYTAYGRHAEAVTFLRNEINKAPERSDLKIRLLEVLVEMRDATAFQAEADKFGADKRVAARLPDMRQQLGLGAAESDDDDFGGLTDNDEPSLDDLELDLAADLETRQAPAIADAPLEFDMGLDDDASDETLVLDSGDADQDFELDLESTGSGAAVDTGKDDDNTISFDMGDSDELSLDLEEDEAPALDEAMQREVDEAMSVEPALDLGSSSDDGDELLDLDDIELADASEEFNEAAQQPSSEDIDLSLDDFDLDTALDEEPAAAASLEDELSLESDDLELSLEDDGADDDLSLSLDEATEVGLSAIQPDATVQRESLDDIAATDVRTAVDAPANDFGAGDDDDFEFLGDTDENATKLDLAKAYIDMGDAEGARDILNEVLAEGSQQQQSEAKELLAQVG